MAYQFLRGDTAANDAYTGPVGSLSIDTELWEVRLHDGVTAGGTVVGSLAALGSAAYLDTGTATGDAMLVGSFGVGEVGNAPALGTTDAVDTATGMYRFTSGTTGTIPSGTAGYVLIERYNSTRLKQTYTPIDTDELWVRTYNGSVWGTWARKYDAADLSTDVPAVSVTANATTLSIQAWIADLDSRVTALEP